MPDWEGALIERLSFCWFCVFFCSGKLKPHPEEERAEGASRNNTSPAVAEAHWARALVKLGQPLVVDSTKYVVIWQLLSVREFKTLHYVIYEYKCISIIIGPFAEKNLK